MERPNLNKIIKDNLDKAKFQSKSQPSLPTDGWLNQYQSGGVYLSDKAKATQFGQYKRGGGYFPEYHSWAPPRMQFAGQVSQQDSVRHLAGQTMDYEAKKGSPTGGGLSDWGYHSSQLPYNKVPSNWHAPQTRDEAVNLYMQEIGNSPILGHFSTAMEKGEAGDFLYNTGRDPRVYMLDQYLRSKGQAGLPNRGSYNVDTKTDKWTPALQNSLDQQWNQYKEEINKLPVNQRRILLNKGRDFYYQNINQVNGKPNPSYEATWKPRIWESVNTYKKNGGDISIPDLNTNNWLMKYQTAGQVNFGLPNPRDLQRQMMNRSDVPLSIQEKQKEGGMINTYGPGGQTTDGCPAGYNKHPLTGECIPNGWVAPMQAGPTVQNAERLRKAAAFNRGTTGPTIGQSRSDEPWRQRQAAEMRRQNAQQNSALAQTMGSFTPSGYNPAAGVIGAETFTNMNPLITGPIMSTSRLYGAGRSMVDPNTYNPYFGSDKGVVGNILGGLNLAGDIGMLRTGLRKPTGSFNPEPNPANRIEWSDFTERNARVKQAWADAQKRKAGIPATSSDYWEYLKNLEKEKEAGDIIRSQKLFEPDPSASVDISEIVNKRGLVTPGYKSSLKVGPFWQKNKNQILRIMQGDATAEANAARLKFIKDAQTFKKNVIDVNDVSQSPNTLYQNIHQLIKEGNIRDAFPDNTETNTGNQMADHIIGFLKNNMSLTDAEAADLLHGYNPSNPFTNWSDARINNAIKILNQQRLASGLMWPTPDPMVNVGAGKLPLFGRYSYAEKNPIENLTKTALNNLKNTDKALINNAPDWFDETIAKGNWKDVGMEMRGSMKQRGLDPANEQDVLKFIEIFKAEQKANALKNYSGRPNVEDLFRGMNQNKYGGSTYGNGGMITDPMGQWKYPGMNTRIPGNNITMQGVPYPVLAKASNGMSAVMQPGQNYSFPGASHVDEYPMTGWLNKYQGGGGTEYTVQPGDNLSKISRNTGASVRQLTMANNLSNPNLIRANQKLIIPSTNTSQPSQSYQSWDDLRTRVNQLNALQDNNDYTGDEQRISQYYTNRPDESYVVVDKKRARMNVYKGNKLQKTYEVGTGANPGDAQTVTRRINGKTDWDSGNRSTGAGVYTISNIDPKSHEYFDLPAFNLKNDRGMEVATTIHGTPMARRAKFDNNDIADNRMSYGCINGKCYDLKDLYGRVDVGSKVYILPEDEGNTMQIVDGKPVLRVNPKNRAKYNQYVDKTGKVQKGQGINESVNTLQYKPIMGLLDRKSFINDVYQSYDSNDEEEYKKNTKPYFNSLVNNKKKVMQATHIPSDVYNEIAKISFGIYGAESNFGDENNPINNAVKTLVKVKPISSLFQSIANFKPTVVTDDKVGGPDVRFKASLPGALDSNKSVGFTQIRWSELNKDEKDVLKKLGVSSNKDFLDPEKAAMATTAILAVRYNQQLDSDQKKDIWKYLPNKWNKRANYADRVKRNSKYITFKQYDSKLEMGGEINWLNKYK